MAHWRAVPVKNTFLQAGPFRSPSLEVFFRERQVRSCPGSPTGVRAGAQTGDAAPEVTLLAPLRTGTDDVAGWTCGACGYLHLGAESGLPVCAGCGAVWPGRRGRPTNGADRTASQSRVSSLSPDYMIWHHPSTLPEPQLVLAVARGILPCGALNLLGSNVVSFENAFDQQGSLPDAMLNDEIKDSIKDFKCPAETGTPDVPQLVPSDKSSAHSTSGAIGGEGRNHVSPGVLPTIDRRRPCARDGGTGGAPTREARKKSRSPSSLAHHQCQEKPLPVPPAAVQQSFCWPTATVLALMFAVAVACSALAVAVVLRGGAHQVAVAPSVGVPSATHQEGFPLCPEELQPWQCERISDTSSAMAEDYRPPVSVGSPMPAIDEFVHPSFGAETEVATRRHEVMAEESDSTRHIVEPSFEDFQDAMDGVAGLMRRFEQLRPLLGRLEEEDSDGSMAQEGQRMYGRFAELVERMRAASTSGANVLLAAKAARLFTFHRDLALLVVRIEHGLGTFPGGHPSFQSNQVPSPMATVTHRPPQVPTPSSLITSSADLGATAMPSTPLPPPTLTPTSSSLMPSPSSLLLQPRPQPPLLSADHSAAGLLGTETEDRGEGVNREAVPNDIPSAASGGSTERLGGAVSSATTLRLQNAMKRVVAGMQRFAALQPQLGDQSPQVIDNIARRGRELDDVLFALQRRGVELESTGRPMSETDGREYAGQLEDLAEEQAAFVGQVEAAVWHGQPAGATEEESDGAQ